MVNGQVQNFKYPAWKIWLLVTAILLALLVMISGARCLNFTTDFRTYFSSDNPQLQAFEQLEADFNKQDTLVFLVEMSDKKASLINLIGIDFLQQLTEMSWQIPYARRVDSLINFQRVESVDDELIINDLIPTEANLDADFLLEISQYIQQQPRLSGSLISQDESLALVVVSLSLPDGNEQATAELVDFARNSLAELDQDDIEVQLFGSSVINLALAEAVERDMALLIPLSYLMIFVAIYFLSKSLVGTLLALMMTLLTVASVFGIYGWSGKSLTPVVGAVPSMIMIIVIADCMHLLVSFQHFLHQGLEKSAAILSALKINIKPVAVTSITTALGLLCLNFSESPPYRDLGNMVAMAAIIAGMLALTWFPALLLLLPVKAPSKMVEISSSQDKFHFFTEKLLRYPSQIMASAVFLLVTASWGISQLEFNEQWHQYYDESYDVRQALDTQDTKLYGVNFISYSVESGQADGIYNVNYQQQLDELVNWIAGLDKVGYVDAIPAQIKELNQKLQANDLQMFKIPESRELIAQSMMVYEMSLPFGMGMEQYINIDRSSTRLTVNMHKSSSKELIAVDQKILNYVEKNLPALTIQSGTGLDMVFAKISESNTQSLLQGTGLALLLISLLLVLVLKSVRLGVISIIPNVIPIVIAYGVWGFSNGRIDLGLSIVACMSLGLVVDDTVHFLSKYQLAREKNKTVEEAIQYAFSTVGMAMIITTCVLAIGFSLLALSSFAPTHGMGALLALTAVFALLIDFIFLPILLMNFDKR